jgi:hypothetical protein
MLQGPSTKYYSQQTFQFLKWPLVEKDADTRLGFARLEPIAYYGLAQEVFAQWLGVTQLKAQGWGLNAPHNSQQNPPKTPVFHAI